MGVITMQTETVERRCPGCGAKLTLEVPVAPATPNPGRSESLQSKLARYARTMAENVRCDRCAEADERAEAEQAALDRFRDHLSTSGMPRRLRRHRFDEFLTTANTVGAVDAALTWAAGDDPRGLLLTGPVGRGKTMLAACAALRRMEREPVAWCSVAQLLATLRGPFKDEERAAALRRVRGRSAIVLDDLDKATPSDFVNEQLFAVIDGRIAAGAPLLVTSNLAPSEIGAIYGEPIMSRLAGYCRRFELDGPDRRVTAVAA